MGIKKRRTKQDTDKTKVYVEHACFICGKVSHAVKEIIIHVERMHGYEIPTHPVGKNRPKDDQFEYIADKKKKHDTEHYGCPSCWYRCPQGNLDDLNTHTLDEHDVVNVDISKNHGSFTTGEIRRRSRSASISSGETLTISAGSMVPTTSNGATTEVAVKDITIKLDEIIDTLKNLFA